MRMIFKRNGLEQILDKSKIILRITKQSNGLKIDPNQVVEKVMLGICENIKTTEIDDLIAEISASMTTKHYDYDTLAARIAISKLHKETREDFTEVGDILYQNSIVDVKLQTKYPLKHWRDFNFSYFGFKTLEKSYLLRVAGKIVERPQHMFMRVALQIHPKDPVSAAQTYELLSQKYYIHATPTLFHASTRQNQLSSCYLLTAKKETDFMRTLDECKTILEHQGGIGLAADFISIPILRVLNSVVRYVSDEKRPCTVIIYVESWHYKIFEILNSKKNTGNEEERTRDLFYALWIPDLFMKRVRDDTTWVLMSPEKCPGLSDIHGEEFETLYTKYEAEGHKTIPARMLWKAILECQIETGGPFMLYKEACNKKSNQKNLGTKRCSNLCTEIVQYSSQDEIAVCNLASLALNRFVHNGSFDFNKLKEVTKIVCRNLDRIIDANLYPLEKAKLSNAKHRPIGIGVQGLADTFCLMKYPFDCEEARRLNREIFETIYFGALEASNELARNSGQPYASYKDSPVSKGILQFDMWNVKPSSRWDWVDLKSKIAEYGVRNSLLIAVMPTASTAHILGNNESTEPFTNNIFSRRVLSGDYQIVNRYLLDDLFELNIWNEETRKEILQNRGSIQTLLIPDKLKEIYRTVWEIPQKSLIDMAVDRAPFVDQSQSLSIFMAEPSYEKLTSLHFYGWKKGLKTGMYYLRTQPTVNAIQFTLEKSCCKG